LKDEEIDALVLAEEQVEWDKLERGMTNLVTQTQEALRRSGITGAARMTGDANGDTTTMGGMSGMSSIGIGMGTGTAIAAMVPSLKDGLGHGGSGSRKDNDGGAANVSVDSAFHDAVNAAVQTRAKAMRKLVQYLILKGFVVVKGRLGAVFHGMRWEAIVCGAVQCHGMGCDGKLRKGTRWWVKSSCVVIVMMWLSAGIKLQYCNMFTVLLRDHSHGSHHIAPHQTISSNHKELHHIISPRITSHQITCTHSNQHHQTASYHIALRRASNLINQEEHFLHEELAQVLVGDVTDDR
jgi:hypothetical protein